MNYEIFYSAAYDFYQSKSDTELVELINECTRQIKMLKERGDHMYLYEWECIHYACKKILDERNNKKKNRMT
jgi:hypothetical protein